MFKRKPFTLMLPQVKKVTWMNQVYDCSFAFEESEHGPWIVLQRNQYATGIDIIGKAAQHIIDSQLKVKNKSFFKKVLEKLGFKP